jgi:hypothetical protein
VKEGPKQNAIVPLERELRDDKVVFRDDHTRIAEGEMRSQWSLQKVS